MLFLIGMRINTFWRVWEWLPAFLAMGPMIVELYKNPELGFLRARTENDKAHPSPNHGERQGAARALLDRHAHQHVVACLGVATSLLGDGADDR